MTFFRELFEKSQRSPITYQGKILYLYDYIDLNKGDVLKVKVTSTKTKHKVRFSVMITQPYKGKYLKSNDKVWHGFNFWEDTFPKEGTEIKSLKDGVKVSISSGFASIWYWPMTIEEHGNKKIYHCYTDDNEDFNGFVFEIEVQRAN